MRLFNVKYFFLLTFFIITSCQFEEKQDLIDKKMMVQILIDMHLAEKSIENLKYEKDTLEALFHRKEIEILDKYSVSEELYRKSYSYYFFEPEELDKIYEVLLDSLLLYQQTK
tara:strand:- start:1993 stop:2331 length:339 start_codon:yes stop_codon:yes gene_type:complete